MDDVRPIEEAAEEAASSAHAQQGEPKQSKKRGAAEDTPEPIDELEKARSEAAAHLEDARRIKAEFENYRKRILKEQSSLIERASEQLVERLLPILDAFRLALIAADRTKDYDGLVRGVELVYGELVDLMHKEGLAEVASEGKPFDPALHEAVMESEGSRPDGEPFVADVLRPGYTFKGRVVRPAMVKVERR